MPTRASLLKLTLLTFWSIWMSLVVIMNVGDALKVIGILPHDWPAASGNFNAIQDAAAVYGLPKWVDFALYIAVISWETLCSVLLWWALARYRARHDRFLRSTYLAATAVFVLFGGFILSDELFHTFKLEGDHRGITVLLLLTVLALQLLPDRVPR